MWRIRYMIMRILKDNRGIGVVEVILILVGIFTPYYGMGTRCMA